MTSSHRNGTGPSNTWHKASGEACSHDDNEPRPPRIPPGDPEPPGPPAPSSSHGRPFCRCVLHRLERRLRAGPHPQLADRLGPPTPSSEPGSSRAPWASCSTGACSGPARRTSGARPAATRRSRAGSRRRRMPASRSSPAPVRPCGWPRCWWTPRSSSSTTWLSPASSTGPRRSSRSRPRPWPPRPEGTGRRLRTGRRA